MSIRGRDPLYLQHPIAVLRLGGISIADATLPSGEVAGLNRTLRTHRHEYDRLKLVVCDAIALAVPSAYEESPASGRLLLETKRKLHNARRPTALSADLVDRLLGAVERQLFTRATSILDQIADTEDTISEAYRRSLADANRHALSIACDGAVGRAIMLSNPDTFRRLNALLTAPDRFSAKERDQLHITAARYVLRAGLKTSPLSTMGIVALGMWRDDAQAGSPDTGMDITGLTEHLMQLRHAALREVATRLRDAFDDLAPHARVVLNPSLSVRGAMSSWRRVMPDDPPETRVRDTRIERSSSDAGFIRLLRKLFGGATDSTGLSIADLHDSLSEILPTLDSAGRSALLGAAWQRDLLRLDTGNADDPIAQMDHTIAALADPARSGKIAESFELVKASLAHPTSEQTIDDSVSAFSALLRAASIGEPVARYRPVLFEDCRITQPAFEMPGRWQQDLRATLEPLLDLVPILASDSPLHRMRRIIVNRFVDTHGAGGVHADAMEFIADSADHLDRIFDLGGSAGAEPAQFSAPLDIDHGVLLDLRRSFFDLLTRRIRDGRHDGATIRIDPEDLAPLSQAIPASCWPRELSQMFFVQPCRSDDAPSFVLNQIYPGTSSTFSRFIPDTPYHRNLVRDYLSALSEDRPFVELSGDFGFNAANHPRFAAGRVSVPPFGQPGDGTTSLNRFALRHRIESDDLVFVDSDGQDTSMFYPAILTPFLTPRLHQVARITASWIELVGDISTTLLTTLESDTDGITHLPRISLGSLVITRQALCVPRSMLPDPRSGDVSFFTSLSDWADALELPRWLFVRRIAVAVKGSTVTDGPRNGRRLSGKPLPLDRDCPLSVRIFQKELAASRSDVVLTEALPTPDDMPVRHHGRPTVAELGIELSRVFGGVPR